VTFDIPSTLSEEVGTILIENLLMEMKAAKDAHQFVVGAIPAEWVARVIHQANFKDAHPHLWVLRGVTPDQNIVRQSPVNTLLVENGKLFLDASHHPFGQCPPLAFPLPDFKNDEFHAAALLGSVLVAIATEITGDDLFSKQHRKLDPDCLAMRPLHAHRLSEYARAMIESHKSGLESENGSENGSRNKTNFENCLATIQGPPGRPWSTGVHR
jgi:hypothetical protein